MFGRLRARTTLLLVGGILIVDTATFVGLSAIHDSEVEDTLALAAERIERLPPDLPPVRVGLLDAYSPSDLYVAFLDADGRVLTSSAPLSAEEVPDVARPAATGALRAGRPVDLSTPGGEDYRVARTDLRTEVKIQLRGSEATAVVASVVVGYPLASNQRSLRRLVLVEMATAAAVLAMWAWLSNGFVRSALRPLRRIADTARAIASGQTSERVDVGDDRDLEPVASSLNQAFDARQRSEERMRDFVADASHELRTPLASVRGWADLYLEGGVRERGDIDEAMQMIWQEAGRMQDLVEDMLLLTRSGGQVDPAVAPVRVAPLLIEVRDAVAHLCPQHVFAPVAAPADLVVQAEPEAMRRAVGNLLVNAGRHTPAGTRITVSATARGAGAEIRVVDDGPGLTPLERAAAFDRFWRGDAGRARPGGSGLGLPIARSVLRAWGGDLHLEAAPGGGLACVALFAVGGSSADEDGEPDEGGAGDERGGSYPDRDPRETGEADDRE